MAHLITKIAQSSMFSEEAAVQEILDKIIDDETRLIMYFVSPRYKQQLIADAFQKYLGDKLAGHNINYFGCTTAGELSNFGFAINTIVAIAFNSEHIELGLGLVEGISGTPMSAGAEAINRAARHLGTTMEKIKQEAGYAKNYFAFSLIDGLSRVEEFVMLAMKGAAGNIKIVGGSAADSLDMRRTYIHVNGKIYTDAVFVALFKTDLLFEIISTHNFTPTDKYFTVTNANSKERIVYELNGDWASKVYAQALDVHEDDFNEAVFHTNPLGVMQYNQYFLRSPMEILPDGGIRFACFIEYGEKVYLMQRHPIVDTTRAAMAELKETLGTVTGMVCVNCAGRYVEIYNENVGEEIIQALNIGPFIGFNSYGEQFNSLHMNQTLTLMAFGE